MHLSIYFCAVNRTSQRSTTTRRREGEGSGARICDHDVIVRVEVGDLRRPRKQRIRIQHDPGSLFPTQETELKIKEAPSCGHKCLLRFFQ